LCSTKQKGEHHNPEIEALNGVPIAAIVEEKGKEEEKIKSSCN
jgi:hypothetical protein